MTWWSEAQRGAAREFGRRHYRGFLGLLFARKLAPFVLIVGGTALIVWGLTLLVRTLLPVFVLLAVVGALVAAGTAGYRWWTAARPVPWIPAAVVCAIGVAGSIVVSLH